MTSSWKCAQCGLVNFARASNCTRCGAIVSNTGIQQASPPGAIVLEDGYVLPPPPSSGGIWRDKATLILSKDASLPDQCVKCNAPANGVRLKRRLSWHHPAIYILILVAWIIYVILALVLRKQATVYLGLCAEHFQRRREYQAAGWVLLAIGLISPTVAFAANYPALGLLGVLVLITSIIWLVVVTRVVTVKKIDDRFVWLNGINANYLALFPPWQGPV